jgi:ferredoxin
VEPGRAAGERVDGDFVAGGVDGGFVTVGVDGECVTVGAGATVLDACDASGRYVPRLCYYHGLGCPDCSGGDEAVVTSESVPSLGCGLCSVRLGDGTVTLACVTEVTPGMVITTSDPELAALRLTRLATTLAGHPHICLTCPDRDGCARDECTYGNPPEARCCAELGRCELGALVSYVDPDLKLVRRPVTVSRDAHTEGRIRREPGLCVACGRCVRTCETATDAGRALEMTNAMYSGGVARPKQGTLRASGCTFCGRCVLVCPTGALTAPGPEGAAWLARRRERSGLAPQILPPEERRAFTPAGLEGVPQEAGAFRLVDQKGQVLRISGVADLQRGLAQALADGDCPEANYFQVDIDPLYTQRESELLARYAQDHGHLPPGNGVSDDLFDD